MRLDIGWLPVGIIILIGIGLVIRARIRLRHQFDLMPRPSWWTKFYRKVQSFVPKRRSWLIFFLGFFASSWITLLGMQLKIIPFTESLILPLLLGRG